MRGRSGARGDLMESEVGDVRGVRRWVDELQRPPGEEWHGWMASAEYQAFGGAHRRLLADLSGGVVAPDAAGPRIAELHSMAELLADRDERDGAVAEAEAVAGLVAQLSVLDGAGPEWQQASRLVSAANADPALARDAIAQVEALAARAPEGDRLSILRMADFLGRLAAARPGDGRGRS